MLGETTLSVKGETPKLKPSAIDATERKKQHLKTLKANLKPGHKFKAIACQRDGINFPSKLERSYYDLLNQLQAGGQVLFFLRQVGFDLPGKKRYFADFMVFYTNGEVEVVDTKGMDTNISKLKRDQVESIYPIKIKVVKKV